jgi:DNA-binding XRE family transcriptional regulator
LELTREDKSQNDFHFLPLPMSKPASRSFSGYTVDALMLLGQLIKEARIRKSMTAAELSERIGISRSLLLRIEKGDPGCSIGVFFEAATISGVPLFDQDERGIKKTLSMHQEKMNLLPKSVKKSIQVMNDDF